ncbi:MAG: murein biosynthesis integral membrane protein MurJ [Gammaproteobacteria bacterium]|nr:murein biosynthesis integral membrane protein MurJ [Gammaproteobacteria bacterium]
MSLFKSTAIVSAMTLVSRISGLLRDIVMAYVFRIGVGTDAFFVAFKIPNFLRRLFAEGAFNQAFVPVLTEYKVQKEREDVVDLARHVAGTLAGLLSILTVVAVFATPVLITIIAPGYLNDPLKFDMTASMLRITFPYILFISLAALVAGLLNSYGRFAVPAFTPVFLNLILIAAAIWLAPKLDEPVFALAWGVFIAGIVQLGFQLPALYKLGFLRWPRWGWHHQGVRRVMKLMLPGIVGSSAMQINLLFDILIASFLVSGSISWLYYSDRLVEFPLGVFGIALATVILPNLSEKHAQGNPQAFSHMLDWALRWVILIATPAAVALAVLAGPLISTMFYHGQFSEQDVHMSTLSLMAYSIGLLGFIMVKVLAPGYFARQDTKTPVRIALIAMAANMLFNVIFVFGMMALDFEGQHAGLALATTMSALLNASLLYRGLRRQNVYLPSRGWLRLFIQVLLACSAMLAGLLWLGGDLSSWLNAEPLERVGRLAIIVPAGAGVYFVALWIMGIRFSHFHRPQE